MNLRAAYLDCSFEDFDSTVTLVTLGSITGSISWNAKSIWSFHFCNKLNLRTTSAIFWKFIEGEIVISVYLLIASLRKTN